MHLSMRFDFRNPAFANTSMADRYAAALDMAEWADSLGIPASIGISEHHGSDDGYIPSPQLIIAAMAARTQKVRFSIGATIAPFHDPLRLAEDFCVLDNLTRGRFDVIVAGGYAPSEFAMFDVPIKERPKRVTEMVNTLKAAFAGEPFEYRGRTVHVTPSPVRPGGPMVMMGGASEAAARRAARIADGFAPSDPKFWAFYRDEMQRLGMPDPGPGFAGNAEVTALAADLDEGWQAMGPFFLHETNAYGAWRVAAGEETPYEVFPNADALRAANFYHIVTPDEYIDQLRAAPLPLAQFHPLCGGMPIATAWNSLKLFETEVLPAFR
jgi:alkanesulfonate monooxygenase SsuD/methylene tetrahydromethanopterin reductase-like flavin-dependent oxidoreductase (luciferase family)